MKVTKKERIKRRKEEIDVKEELSDFLKLAYQHNKVRDLEEAFEEFPVEEEWHKGKIENVLEEDSEIYRKEYEVGDIVFVQKYKYSDGTMGTNHFFVIIDRNNTAIPIENFGMILSSNLEKLKYKSNKFVEKDAKNHLRKDSIVKTDEIYRILDSQILFKIGKIDYDKIQEYKKCFKNQLESSSN